MGQEIELSFFSAWVCDLEFRRKSVSEESDTSVSVFLDMPWTASTDLTENYRIVQLK